MFTKMVSTSENSFSLIRKTKERKIVEENS